MKILTAVRYEVAIEPAHENKLAGIAWIFSGPGIPIGMGVAAGLLYMGWDTFSHVSRRGARATAWTVPGLGLGFLLGFFLSASIVSAFVMGAALALHAGAFVALHVAAFSVGVPPWARSNAKAGSSSGESEDEGWSRTARRRFFIGGAVVWLLLSVGTLLYGIGGISDVLLPTESTTGAKLYDRYGWCALLLAPASYGLLEVGPPTLERASVWAPRIARGSSFLLFLVGAWALMSPDGRGQPFVLVQGTVVAVHIGSVAAAFGFGGRRLGRR